MRMKHNILHCVGTYTFHPEAKTRGAKACAEVTRPPVEVVSSQPISCFLRPPLTHFRFSVSNRFCHQPSNVRAAPMPTRDRAHQQPSPRPLWRLSLRERSSPPLSVAPALFGLTRLPSSALSRARRSINHA